jgi:hypothetical protein
LSQDAFEHDARGRVLIAEEANQIAVVLHSKLGVPPS